MISPAIRAFGIALLLASVVVAVLLLPALSSPSDVGAHECDSSVSPMDEHEDFHEIACTEAGHDDPHENVIEVNGGRDNEMVFRVYPPSSRDYLGAGDQIKITLTDFRLAGAVFHADGSNNGNYDLIGITDSSSSTTTVRPENAEVDPNAPETLVLNLPPSLESLELADGEGEHLIITIEAGTGILAPEAPKGFHDPTRRDQGDGYPVEIIFIDTQNNAGPQTFPAEDENFVIVKNPVNSTEPGATVRIDLVTYASDEIGSNEEIIVDFSGPSEDTHFILPSTISTSRIKIRSDETFDPADVLVQGERVILTIPDDEEVLEGDFTISFSQLARIKNPFVAGNRVITVSSFAPGFRDDEITAVIRRTTTIDPSEGLRGTEFTLEGKGYQLGTVTVFEGPDDVINAGETLASVKTTRGAFSVKLNAAGEYGDSRYTVNTRDSYGVADQVDFSIKSSIYFEPASVNVGSKLRVTIFDWEDDYNEVVAVRIAGQAAHLPKAVSEFDNCYDYAGVYRPNSIGMVSLEVTVPTGVPPGEQTVSVYGQEQLDHRYDDGTNVPDPDKGPCANLPDAEMKGSATGRKVIVRLKNDPNPIVTATIEVESEPLK